VREAVERVVGRATKTLLLPRKYALVESCSGLVEGGECHIEV